MWNLERTPYEASDLMPPGAGSVHSHSHGYVRAVHRLSRNPLALAVVSGRAWRARRPRKEAPMISRDRRSPAGRRGSNLKARLGIATAVVVGGGAIGAVAVATTSHTATPSAQSAGYSSSYHHYSPYANQA